MCYSLTNIETWVLNQIEIGYWLDRLPWPLYMAESKFIFVMRWDAFHSCDVARSYWCLISRIQLIIITMYELTHYACTLYTSLSFMTWFQMIWKQWFAFLTFYDVMCSVLCCTICPFCSSLYTISYSYMYLLFSYLVPWNALFFSCMIPHIYTWMFSSSVFFTIEFFLYACMNLITCNVSFSWMLIWPVFITDCRQQHIVFVVLGIRVCGEFEQGVVSSHQCI